MRSAAEPSKRVCEVRIIKTLKPFKGFTWLILPERREGPAAAIDAAAALFPAEVKSRRAKARGAAESQRCFFSAPSTIALTARQSSTPAIVPSLP